MMIGLVKTAFVGTNLSPKQLSELYLTCPNSEITAYECKYAFVVQDKSALQEFTELNYADREIAPGSELYCLNADELIKELKAFELKDSTQDIQEKLDLLLTDKQKQEIESVKEKMSALN